MFKTTINLVGRDKSNIPIISGPYAGKYLSLGGTDMAHCNIRIHEKGADPYFRGYRDRCILVKENPLTQVGTFIKNGEVEGIYRGYGYHVGSCGPKSALYQALQELDIDPVYVFDLLRKRRRDVKHKKFTIPGIVSREGHKVQLTSDRRRPHKYPSSYRVNIIKQYENRAGAFWVRTSHRGKVRQIHTKKWEALLYDSGTWNFRGISLGCFKSMRKAVEVLVAASRWDKPI